MRRMIISVVAVATIIAAVHAWGVLCEWDFLYWNVLRGVRAAHGPNGQPVASILKKHLGEEAGVHWYTDSYCSYLAHGTYLTYVQFRHGNDVYEFAYHSQLHQLVPMSLGTSARFPELMPVGDRLVPVVAGQTTFINGSELLIPLSWRKRAA